MELLAVCMIMAGVVGMIASAGFFLASFDSNVPLGLRERALSVIAFFTCAALLGGGISTFPDPEPLAADQYYCSVTQGGEFLRCNDEQEAELQYLIEIEPTDSYTTSWGVCRQIDDLVACYNGKYIYKPVTSLPTKDAA